DVTDTEISSSLSERFVRRTPEREVDKSFTGGMGPQAKSFWHSAVLGVGLKRRFGYKYVLVDLRYNLGMSNMINVDKVNSFDNVNNKIKVFSGMDTEDDYRWNNIELSFGFVWPIYYPREKNTVTIQTMVKKWLSKKDKKNE
ncbi:MAG: hypothetical protein ABFS32_20410, partial [Bacteroidota bacterium]